ncbi:MAG: DUF2934 domain-containing protein [Candidatus Thiodiazotropha sp.]
MGKKHKKEKPQSDQDEDLKKKEKKKKKKSKDKSAKKSAKAMTRTTAVDPEMRHQMIATAAYYIAEKHHFDASRSVEYWQQAEREIDALLGKNG